MNRTMLLLATLLTAPLMYAQGDHRDGYRRDHVENVVAPLLYELERLRQDENVVEFASEQLARAEDYIQRLANVPPHELQAEDVEKAVRMLRRAERVAHRRMDSGPDREVVIVDDQGARDEARQARSDAEQARLEAEQERAENARLRAELGQAQTRVTERGIVLTLGDVLFAVDKADLTTAGARTLDKLVGAMRRDPDNAVTIEGHTDSTGKHAYNMELSKRRAYAVRNYLTVKGIAARRIQSGGLGPDFPVASNANAAGRQQNRRVEVLVQNDGFDQ